jgi:hypothetical protein
MATCVERKACPDCDSSDSIQTYLNIDDALEIEWYTSFCHGECWEPKGDPYVGKTAPKVHVKTIEEVAGEVNDVKACRLFIPKKKYRGIPGKYFKSWGVRVLLSEFDGKTPYALAFPVSYNGELMGWKCRPLKSKNFYGIGITNNIDPFGLERAFRLGGNTLWFTEGEFDAIALDYCMTQAGGKDRYPVVSLTHGGGSLEKNLKLIRSRLEARNYKNLVFVLDDDPVGHLAEDRAKELWPDAIIVNKPKGQKDANDAVESGLIMEMGNLALRPKR